jgi:hypothetical protein
MKRTEINVITGLVTETELSAEEIAAIAATAADAAWASLKARAMAALNESDTTVMRCYESGIALPDEWSPGIAGYRFGIFW